MSVVTKTVVSVYENIKIEYRKRSFLLLSWYEKVNETSLWKDLVITTLEEYDNIVINWKVLFCK